MATRRGTSDGFTLTELIVMLSVLGLAMLFAIPNLHRANETWRLKESVATIENSMRRARSTAATERVSVRVTLDATHRECIVEIDDDDDGDFDREVARNAWSERVILDTIDFDGSASVVFDVRGAPENPGSVILRTRGGFAREVMVAAGSGSVSVLEVAEGG